MSQSRAEALKKRLLQKIHQKQKLAPIEEEKTLHFDETEAIKEIDHEISSVVESISPVFRFIMHKNELINPDMGEVAVIDAYRLVKMEQMVEDKLKTLDFNNIAEHLECIYIAVADLWCQHHVDNLTVIEDYPRGCKLSIIGNHNVYILNKKVSHAQLIVEYMGLMWFQNYEKLYGVEDIGRDLIVSLDAYKCYISMIIGEEFYNMYSTHPAIREYAEAYNTSIKNLVVISQHYGNLFYPNEKELKSFTQYLQPYAFWSQFKHANIL